MMLQPTTKLRASRAEARVQHIKLLRQLGWKPDGPLHWKNPRINRITKRQTTYTTGDAILLIKIRGELKRPGHSWAIGNL